MSENLPEANPSPKKPPKEAILPTAVYSRAELARVSGFSTITLIRAEAKGRLRARREGRRVYFLGADALKWLGQEVSS